MTTVGVLHPGAMGSSIGAALAGRGHQVVWASGSRSDATRARAETDGLIDAATLTSLAARSDVIVSVCPPAAALDVATEIAEIGFSGFYLDANATSPDTARQVADAVGAAGASFVDGGIIGPPARVEGLTLLFLSGDPSSRDRIADLFDGSLVETVVLDRPVGAASATKMAFAAWTKGSSALLLAVRALAEHEDVVDGLEHAWAALAPDLPGRVAGTAAGTGPKAWRFEGEMHEIAATFETAGLPGGFHEAAAEVYGALADLRDQHDISLTDVIDRILGREP